MTVYFNNIVMMNLEMHHHRKNLGFKYLPIAMHS